MSTDFERYRLQYQPDWRLEMENQIGHGGFGEVYKERIRRPGMFRSELCAVKKIAFSIANQTGDLQRYKREIAILASLVHHEWFVQFFGWCENKDFVFIAMEYMELGDLGRHLEAPWSESDTKIVAEQLLKGLSVLHRAGIAHRDLKPQNVFPILLDDGCLRIKIGDFGVSKLVASNSNTGLRTAIRVPGYTAPEIIGLLDSYTNAIDLWSLGCLVYRMICGEDLFCSLQDVVCYKFKILSFPRAKLNTLGLSHNAVDFMERLLQGNPQHRPTADDALSCSWISSEPLGYKVSSRQAEHFQKRIQPPEHTILENAETSPLQFGREASALDHSSYTTPHMSLAVGLPSGRENRTIAVSRRTLDDHSYRVRSVAFSTEGKRPASGFYEDTARMWDPSAWECRATLRGHSNGVTSVALSPDGEHLASGAYDPTVNLWHPSTGACQATLRGHSSTVYTVAFSLDGKRLASGSHDSTIKLWNPRTRVCHATLTGHSGMINSVAFSPDGGHLASGSFDNTVKLWDSMGVCQATLEGHSLGVASVAFSPDGARLASGSYDRTVRLWDPSTGACQAILRGHSDMIISVAFSPDGKCLASGSSDKTLKLWDPSAGACQATLKGHSSTVYSVVFSPDGKCLASGSSDNTVKLWDPSTGECQVTLKEHSRRVYSVAFSADGRRLVSGSHDDTIKLWSTGVGIRR